MGWIQISHAIRRQAPGLFSSYCHRYAAELRDQAAWKLWRKSVHAQLPCLDTPLSIQTRTALCPMAGWYISPILVWTSMQKNSSPLVVEALNLVDVIAQAEGMSGFNDSSTFNEYAFPFHRGSFIPADLIVPSGKDGVPGYSPNLKWHGTSSPAALEQSARVSQDIKEPNLEKPPSM